MKNYFNITSITEREKLIERNVINKEMHQTQCSTIKWYKKMENHAAAKNGTAQMLGG